jgi:F0F1-type ATP synthase assembly protein I
VSDWLWLFAGLLVGALNVAAIAGTVSRLQRNGNVRALSSVASGFALRLLLSMLVLVVALRQSAAAGLLAFAGIWLGRWTVLLWTHTPADRCKVRT